AMTSILAAQNAAPQMKADVIFIHGNIYTGVEGARGPSASLLVLAQRAEAMAVRGDRIVAVGGRDEIAKWKGPETRVVDLGGHFVMAGFNDAHMHLASAGAERLNVNLVGAKTLEEFRERL